MAGPGRPGRAAKPTTLKVLYGSDKKNPQRTNRDEPVMAFREPRMPEDLTEAQVVIWDETVADLRAMKLLHGADERMLHQYVVAAERAARASKEFSNQPLTVRNPNTGAPMSNPMIKDWIALSNKLTALSMQFGLTPSSRSVIRTKNAQADPKASETANPDRLFG